MSIIPKTVLDHRQYFPRGLAQPEDGFRFSVDALLLACFAGFREPKRVLDLGTGCGVVGLGLLLNHPEAAFHVFGIDHDLKMVEAAKANTTALGLNQRFTATIGDVRSIEETAEFLPGQYDLVLCNPPYRQKGHGRMPIREAKQSACFETSARTEHFILASAKALTIKGRLAMVHLPEHLGRLFTALRACNLEPKRLRFVHGHQHKPASLLLLEARKSGRPGLQVEAPLTLYQRTTDGNALTAETLKFCPFLECNNSRTR